MAQIKVTFILDVDAEPSKETAEHVKGWFESYEGWQIFGDKEPYDESVITDVTAEVL